MMTHLENVFLITLLRLILVLKIQMQKDVLLHRKTPVRMTQPQKDVNLHQILVLKMQPQKDVKL
jgi:hypothetical protein